MTSDVLLFLGFTVLLVAPVFVGSLQIASFLRSSPAERHPAYMEVLAWFREVLVLWFVGALWPLQMLRRTWSRHRGKGETIPVILVPGYLESETLMHRLRNALKQSGRPYATYKYQPLLGPGETQTLRLLSFVREVKASFAADRVDMIGHSFGGLLIRRLLTHCDLHEVGKVVLLAVPHKGSQIAVLAPGQAGRDLQPDSGFIRSLAAEPEVHPTLDLRASCDAMIHPRESARLNESSERLGGAWGHNSMLIAQETIQRVTTFLT